MSVPNVILMAENVLGSELFNMFDSEVGSRLRAEVLFNVSALVLWCLHNNIAPRR
jgi:hypothetical protein